VLRAVARETSRAREGSRVESSDGCVDENSEEGRKKMSYEIEHDVPIPPRGGAKYPWSEMGDGDSISVPEIYEKGKGSAAGSSAASWLKRNRPTWEAVTRRDEDEPETYVRVWFVQFPGGTGDPRSADYDPAYGLVPDRHGDNGVDG